MKGFFTKIVPDAYKNRKGGGENPHLLYFYVETQSLRLYYTL